MLEAYDLADESRPRFSRLLKERGVDLLLTPAATGEAPKGLSNTGDPIFNVMWSVLHVPCVAMPCSRGINNLPIGVQLVSGRFADSSLLRQSTALARLIDIEALRLPIS
jgi:Asp-tRNA(Asn)/Glu-tRNA(Gln) amidotransferase A subunit family amidase